MGNEFVILGINLSILLFTSKQKMVRLQISFVHLNPVFGSFLEFFLQKFLGSFVAVGTHRTLKLAARELRLASSCS